MRKWLRTGRGGHAAEAARKLTGPAPACWLSGGSLSHPPCKVRYRINFSPCSPAVKQPCRRRPFLWRTFQACTASLGRGSGERGGVSVFMADGGVGGFDSGSNGGRFRGGGDIVHATGDLGRTHGASERGSGGEEGRLCRGKEAQAEGGEWAGGEAEWEAEYTTAAARRRGAKQRNKKRWW